MARVKIPYYVVKKGHGYWQPTKAMRGEGFASIRCGKDGPDAWTIAAGWNERWQRHRRGIEEAVRPRWPRGSFGDAFDRFRTMDEWSEKKPRTREEWERGFARIAPVFGDMSPMDPDVSLQALSAFRRRIAETVSPREAWRTIKIWRALWNVTAAIGLTGAKKDPSLGIRNRQPAARSLRWYEGEAVRLVKRAWREGYHGLAAAIACTWDTMMSPVDVRSLTVEQRRRDPLGTYFVAGRTKTGAAAIGTLSRRAVRILDAYLEREPVEVGPIFRNRSGRQYSRFTLPDDFAVVRQLEFPGDTRTLADMRRSGAMEARAGNADPATLSAKMANSISTSNALHRAYQPVDLASVRGADLARRLGRRRTANETEITGLK
ncbi:hypothetical protein VQ042_17905 [Aurantimonas sp. A2-1-M11]|uniref:hypothetical protein n=1 Tax=Aurantimonas sp. A2-1-M11 TaxID=3113712 RepID=UPI002F925A34